MNTIKHTQSFTIETPYGSFECEATFKYWYDTLGIGGQPKEFMVELIDWDVIDQETYDGRGVTDYRFEEIENQLYTLCEDYARAHLKLGAPVI